MGNIFKRSTYPQSGRPLSVNWSKEKGVSFDGIDTVHEGMGLILVGKTGSGKSSLGNVLLQKKDVNSSKPQSAPAEDATHQTRGTETLISTTSEGQTRDVESPMPCSEAHVASTDQAQGTETLTSESQTQNTPAADSEDQVQKRAPITADVQDHGFVISNGLRSATATCSYMEFTNAWGRHIKVVDTPGLFDTGTSLHMTLIELTKVMSLSVPGPHAILFVIRLDVRFTQEEDEAFRKVLLMFQKDAKDTDPMKDVTNFLFVVFTHGELLDEDKITIEGFIDNAPERLKDIIGIVGDRYAVISKPANMDSGRRKREVENLLAKIDVNSKSGDNYYTNDILQKMGKLLNEEIQIVAEKRNVSLQKADRLVMKELEKEEKAIRSTPMTLLLPIVYTSKAFAKLIGRSPPPMPEKLDAEEIYAFLKRVFAKLEEKARQRAPSVCVIS